MLPWNNLFRPSDLESLVCSDETKVWLESIISSRAIPNVTLYSKDPGVGKTTIAKLIGKLLLEEDEILFINGSLDRTIDTIRNDMVEFINRNTFGGNRKLIIIDEADSMNALTLPALRGFIEEYEKFCAFILTCNNINKIPEAIQSRCIPRDMTITKGSKVGVKIFDRLKTILEENKISFHDKELKQIILKYFPDIRKMVSILQSSSISGKLEYISSNNTIEDYEYDFNLLYKQIQAWDWTAIRKFVKINHNDFTIYDKFGDYLIDNAKKDAESVIPLVAKYTLQAGLTRSLEANMAAFLMELK